MDTERLRRTLIILLILAVLTFLVEKTLQVAAMLGNLILLFALAWLVAFIIGPLVTSVGRITVPASLVRWAEPRLGARFARRLARLHLTRGLAAVMIYLGFLAVILVVFLFLAPVAASQLYDFGAGLPQYAAALPTLLAYYEQELSRLGLQVDLPGFLKSQDLVSYVQNIGTLIVQNALGIATGLVSLVIDLFIVLILSFYMTLDGARLAQRLLDLTPAGWRDEAQLFMQVTDRTFGGFVRGQLFQAFLIALGTAAVMALAGIEFIVLVSLMVMVFMLIPVVGPFIALLPPVILAIFQQPGAALWVLLVLLVYQQVVINAFMPRMMGGMVGLHPILVFAALLVGMRFAGAWGSLFAIPIAGVLASIMLFFYLRLLRTGSLSGDVDVSGSQEFSLASQLDMQSASERGTPENESPSA